MSRETSAGDGALGSLTLSRVAEITGGRLEGDPARTVADVAPVDQAGADRMAFLASKRYAEAAVASEAGAFLVSSELEPYVAERPRVVVEDAHRALQALLAALHPPVPHEPGVHPTAWVDPSAELGEGVRVGPGCVVGPGVTLGPRCVLHAQVTVMAQSRLGPGCELWPGVVVRDRCVLGARCILHPGVVIGADGFGYRPEASALEANCPSVLHIPGALFRL